MLVVLMSVKIPSMLFCLFAIVSIFAGKFKEYLMSLDKFSSVLAAAAMACVVTGCDGVFDYHPYDARFDGETGHNASAISRIEAATVDKDTLHVAFISDSHGWYTETEDMVNDINSRGVADFVVHLGDLTDCATTKEYVWQRGVLSKLGVPYVALLGNHDCLGTGEEVFLRMYGESNFSFIAGRVKFVCLNTNATEYDYVAANPDFDYMEEQMTADSARFDRTIVCMHACPYSDQFNNNVAKPFELYVTHFPGIMFCVYGHDHHQAASEIFDDGLMYYGVDCASHRSYMLFTITPDGYEYEVVDF